MELPPCTDMLSTLPDDVLLAILDKLGTAREAMRVCVLSRRWAKLPWLLPEPRISIAEFLPKETQLYELRATELRRAMDAFCRAVSSFLSTADGTTTRCLKLEFCLAEGCTSALQRLLGGSSKVGALQLAIKTTVLEAECDDKMMCRYARRFEHFMLGAPGMFRLLTRLELSNLWLGSANVAAILGTCPRLEHLELRNCCSKDSGGEREELVIDAPPRLSLREVVLDACFYKLVVLRNLPELTRLKCDMWFAVRAPLSLCGVPSLETLVLANPARPASKGFRLSELLANATGLRCLSLNFRGEKIWIQPEPPRTLFAAFRKLTALSIGGVSAQCDLLWMMILLEAASFLREFKIMVQKHFCLGEDFNKARTMALLWKQSDFSHNHLEILQITGFEIQDKYLKFVRLVMERAKNLKIVILADEEPCEFCDSADDPTSSLTRSTYPKNEDDKSSILKKFKDELPSSVQIIIR